MDSFKERAKDYVEEAAEKGEDVLGKTGLPRWLWPLAVIAGVIVVAVIVQAVLV